ncbi:MAG: hypothetical protein ABI668_04600 [Sphingorhabdus sp.]
MAKFETRLALSIASAISMLSLAGGVHAQSGPAVTEKLTAPAPEGEVPPPTMDTNEDGIPDAWDRDANGIPDAWDVNGDRKPDVFDNDGDGTPDDKAAKPKLKS